MSKNVKEVNKGSTAVTNAISTLKDKGTVKTSGNIFKDVISTLRTSYTRLIENRSISVNYSNFEITLN